MICLSDLEFHLSIIPPIIYPLTRLSMEICCEELVHVPGRLRHPHIYHREAGSVIRLRLKT